MSLTRFAARAALLCCAVTLLGASRFPSAVSGVYTNEDSISCCWMGKAATLRITPPQNAASLVLIFLVPDYKPFRVQPERLTIRVNDGKPTHFCCYAQGEHAIAIELGKNLRSASLIQMVAAVTFVPKDLGLNADMRRLSIVLRGIQYRDAAGLVVESSGSIPRPAARLTTLLFALFVVLFALSLWLAWKHPIYALGLLVLLEPFGPTVGAGPTTITFFKVAELGTLVGLVPHAPWKMLSRREGWLPLLCVLGLAAAALISVVHAQYRIPVFRETLKYVEYTILFALSFALFRIARDRVLAGAAFVLIVFAVCATALVQESPHAAEATFVLGHAIPRIAGTLEGPNQLAGWIELLVPVLLALRMQQTLRVPATMAVILAIATSLLTLSRAGLLGLFAGVAVFTIVSWRAQGARLRPFAIGALVAAGALFLYRALPGGPQSAGALNGGLGTRAQLWNAAIALWRSHPIVGIGAGNYETQLPRLGLLGLRTHANSWYLQGLAEGGVIMFVAILATIYGLVSTFLRSRDLLATAALSATVAICVHQIFDDMIFFPKVAAMWFLIAGIGAASVTEFVPETKLRAS